MWPGVCSVAHGEAADLELVARLEVAGRAVDELALGRVDQHLRVREAVEHRGELGHVVVVVVGEQHVRDRDVRRASALSSSGRTGPPASTKNAVAAGPGGDEVGVRQPVGVHRALDDHGREASG